MNWDERTSEIETTQLLEAIFQRFGYDFRHYNRASLSRRIEFVLRKHGLGNISELQALFLHDKEKVAELISDFTVVVTEMFRDPHFFLTFRKIVVPQLKTYPFVRIWHAGCGSGEEVYSMAILLHEEGLLEKSTIYATDINYDALRQAKAGIYDTNKMKTYSANYRKAGGVGEFADYYHSAYEFTKMEDFLKSNMVFADHNLVTDSGFNEMHVVLCRNVLIYFSKPLQNRVFKLFSHSLVPRGFLGLGTKETLKFSEIDTDFKALSTEERIFQRQF